MSEIQDCSKYFLMHEAEISRNAKAISDLNETIKPVTMLDTTIKTLHAEVEKLRGIIERIGDKYISKELADAYILRRDEQQKSVEKILDQLAENNKWLTRGLISVLLYAAFDILKTTMLK